MKKIIYTIALLVSVQFAIGQIVLTEDFSASQMPPQGWSIEGNNNWRISNTANAGGDAPEGKLTWTPQFNGTTRLVSPELDLGGASKALLRFKHMIDHYSSTYTIGISTRSDNGPWNNAYTQTVSSNIPAQEILILIENDDIGSSTFQFSLFFTGSSFNLNDWYFDDFELIVPYNLDLALSSVDVPKFFFEDADVSGTVLNLGNETITSFDLNWQANDGEVYTNAFTGLSVELGDSYAYLSETQLEAIPGSYLLSVWVSNVNGGDEDDNPENDLMEKIVGVPSQTVQRKPLFEIFTASTCPPCAPFATVFNSFATTNDDDITYVKYQMNWPGAGDPYYTAEGGVRRTYYGVSGVPSAFTDGRSTPTNAAGVNNQFNISMNTAAFVEISGQHVINGTVVETTAELISYVDLHDVSLHVVVMERETTGNVGTNGQTSFKHVMMKMKPDADGSTISLENGVPYSINLSADMAGTFVEEMDDLMVVIFLQDDSDMAIFQSEYSVEVGAFVAFNPESGSTGHTTDIDITVGFSQEVFMLGGDPITNDNVASLVTLVDADGNPHPFTATINDEKTEITVDPDGLLNSWSWYYLTVSEVENEHGMPTQVASTHFETGIHVGLAGTTKLPDFAIYPNPAQNAFRANFTVVNETTALLAIYDLNGRLIEAFPLQGLKAGNNQASIKPTVDLPAGVYVVKLQTDDTTQTNRLVIK